MIFLYIIVGYILVTYIIGAIVFRTTKGSGNHVRNWGSFYFMLSPIVVPMMIYCFIVDLFD